MVCRSTEYCTTATADWIKLYNCKLVGYIVYRDFDKKDVKCTPSKTDVQRLLQLRNLDLVENGILIITQALASKQGSTFQKNIAPRTQAFKLMNDNALEPVRQTYFQFTTSPNTNI